MLVREPINNHVPVIPDSEGKFGLIQLESDKSKFARRSFVFPKRSYAIFEPFSNFLELSEEIEKKDPK